MNIEGGGGGLIFCLGIGEIDKYFFFFLNVIYVLQIDKYIYGYLCIQSCEWFISEFGRGFYIRQWMVCLCNDVCVMIF